MHPLKKPARSGRPRKFDEEEALEKAMEVFWRKGYDAASLSELTGAMGINPPSLYAAFGNKEELFLRVLARYGEGPASYSMKALEAPTAREVARRRLYGAVEQMFDQTRPPGCLAVQAVSKCGDRESVIGRKVSADFERVNRAYVKRFQRAQEEGDLPKSAKPVLLARSVNALAIGIAVQAACGASREELEGIAAMALEQFPPAKRRVRKRVPIRKR